MKISPRDHSLPHNPFLRELLGRDDGVVHWLDDSVRVHDGPRRVTVALDLKSIARWCAEHSFDRFLLEWADALRGHRFLVEHTSVNPVHPLHAGSMRGTLIGNVLAKLLMSAGADVEVRYFVNDLGRQVRLMSSVVDQVRWQDVPPEVRFDHAVGVVYALVNMVFGRRTADTARLVGQHSWLTSVVDPSALHAGVDHDTAARDRFVPGMLKHAADDMRLLGAEIDVYEYESSLSGSLRGVALDLAHRAPTALVNGTLCLSRPDGRVPLARPDGVPLYFTRDVANARNRVADGRHVLHVIGDDQVLLQRALRHAVPAIEHVQFGVVRERGKKFSARQNRLLTVEHLRAEPATRGLWELALGLLLVRRKRPVDVAHLTGGAAVRDVVSARRASRRSLSDPRTPGPELDERGQRLAVLMLRLPSVLRSVLTTRCPSTLTRYLVALSRLYLSVTRSGPVAHWLHEWFFGTQQHLARLHGMDLDALGAAFAASDQQNRRKT
ncbi:hypothetical protein SUDANB95_04901 [Actinosynnema sp. ALI-1.44]